MADVRVAALYDVHGNAPALEAVLADVARANVDLVVFGGDVVWGAWPRETLELTRSLAGRARFVMGNTDRASLTGGEDPSALWVQERLSDDERRFVLSWPATLSLGGVPYCHATPRSDTRVVDPGSVGNPTVRATAWWAILDDDVELRTTDYDTRATAEAWRATGYPRPDVADELDEPPARDELPAMLR